MVPVRHRPAYQLQKQLRQAGVTQLDIAERARVSESLVSLVIRRRRVSAGAAKQAAIWAAIEQALNGRD
jgi:transcriptional regulator with XRE-family HTH domain